MGWFILAERLLTFAHYVDACSACRAKSSEKVLSSYLFTTGLLGAIPIVLLGGGLGYIWKKSLAINAEAKRQSELAENTNRAEGSADHKTESE